MRRDLRGLQKDTADSVARHLVAAGTLVDEDPELALQHARYARRRASRIAVVREAAGIAAYHAGEWNEALGELRAARRMGGGPGHIAVMADIERALGRPERALELARGPEVSELSPAEQIELAIVAAGARRDLGELDAAVVGLQISALDPSRRDPWSARLFYAYADNLLAAGRESDALQWFVHTADADTDGETDVAARIAELTGEPNPEDDIVFGEEELTGDEPVSAGETAASDQEKAELPGSPAEAGAAKAADRGAVQADAPVDADAEFADSDADADAEEEGELTDSDTGADADLDAEADDVDTLEAGATDSAQDGADAASPRTGHIGTGSAAGAGQVGEDVSRSTTDRAAGADRRHVVESATASDDDDADDEDAATEAGSADRDGTGS